jgi:hypothetical protein
LVSTNQVFKKHIATLSGDVGQVQLWPHHFDLAVEWFGTRVVEYQEGDEVQEYPSQLNLGLSPGDSGHPEPYFYSNPWPFEKDQLLDKSLPEGARWFTEGGKALFFHMRNWLVMPKPKNDCWPMPVRFLRRLRLH